MKVVTIVEKKVVLTIFLSMEQSRNNYISQDFYSPLGDE